MKFAPRGLQFDPPAGGFTKPQANPPARALAMEPTQIPNSSITGSPAALVFVTR